MLMNPELMGSAMNQIRPNIMAMPGMDPQERARLMAEAERAAQAAAQGAGQPGVAAPMVPPMDPNSVVRPGERPQDPNSVVRPGERPQDPNSVVRPGESPAPKPSLLQRVMGAGRAVNDAVTSVLNPTPAGMQGMFTPEELQAARPNLLRQLIGGPNTPSTREQFAQNLAGLQARKEQERFRGLRAQVAAQFPPQPNETGQDAINRLKEMYAAYAANGDFDMMKQTGEVLKSIGGEGTRPSLREIDLGDRVELRDPYTGALVQTIQKPEGSLSGTPAQQGVQAQRIFQREASLAGDFQGTTKRIAVVADQGRTLRSVVPAALQGNPQAQIALIFAYMKVLDPDSAVREGEYAKAENAAGVPDRIRNLYNRVRDGAFLTPEQVQSFADRSADQEQGWRQIFKTQVGYYTRRANAWGVDPQNVIIDYFAEDPASPGGARAGKPAGKPPAKPPATQYDSYFTP
jgi:hypothetical protein